MAVSTRVLPPLGVFVTALLAAWNANYNGFVWDDRSAVLSNLDAQSSSLSDVFSHDFWGTDIRSEHSHKSYRPLTILSFRLNFLMAGGHSQWLYHFTNAMVHAACALLVYRVGSVLFQEHRDAQLEKENPQDAAPIEMQMEGGTVNVGPLTAGLLFAVHPIHCDAVASIVGRADLLCTALSLMSFLMHVNGASSKRDTNGLGNLVVSMLLTIAAALCKELGFTTFAVLVAYDVLRMHSYKREGMHLRWMQLRLVVTVTVGVIAALVRVWINGEHRQMEWNILANNIVVQDSRLTRGLSYAHVHAWYLWKLLWPRWLCFDYGYNTIPVIDRITDPRNVYSLLAYTMVLTGLYAAAKQLHLVGPRQLNTQPSSLLLTSIAFGAIPFIPASNIVFPVGTVVAERLLYFPSVGFCLLIGCVVDHAISITNKYSNMEEAVVAGTNSALTELRLFGKQPVFFSTARYMILTCGVLLLGSACYRTHLRNAEWVSEDTLFNAAVEIVPTNVKVLSNQAKTLLNSNPQRALDYLRVSLGMVPKHIESNSNIGLAFISLSAKSDDDESLFLNGIRHLYKSAMFAPNHFQAPGFLGSELYKYWLSNKESEAPQSLERFLASDKMASATKFLDHAIDQSSFFPMHFYHRANIAYEVGDYDEAIKYYRMTEVANGVIRDRKVDLELLIDPALVYNMLGVCYNKKRRVEEALTIWRKGIALYPEETDLHVNLALMLHKLGDTKASDAQLRAGLIAAKRPHHIAKLRKIVHVLGNLGFKNAVKAFFDRAAELEQEFKDVQDSGKAG